MRYSFQRSAVFGALGLAFMLGLAINVSAQKSRGNSKAFSEAQKKTLEASQVFNQIMGIRDKAIPRELLDKAEAVAVFPDVIKAGVLIVGGRGGSGVISRRTPSGWSSPAFFKMGGGSFGPQIGASKTDFVLLFMNEEAVKGLLEDKFEIGGEGSIAAGPIGRAVSASTNATLDAGILSYSRSKGLFAGLELKGVVINPDNDLNRDVYGVEAKEILLGNKMRTHQSIRSFPLMLSRYSSRRSS